MRTKNFFDTILTRSSTENPNAGPEVAVLQSARDKCGFIRNTLSNDLGDGYELDIVSVLIEKSMVLADSRYITRSARYQSNSAKGIFSKRDREDAERLMGNMMALRANEHIFCSASMVYH